MKTYFARKVVSKNYREKHYAEIIKESLPNWLLVYLSYKTNIKATQKTEELILTSQKSSEMLTNLACLFDKYVKEVREQSRKMTWMAYANIGLAIATAVSIILRVLHII